MTSDLSPPSGIVKDVVNPETGKTESVFALKADADWIALQAITNGVSGLPVASGNFTDRYGTYTHQNDVEACLKMFETLGEKAKAFGTSSDLANAFAGGLKANSNRPEFLLGEMVWISMRLKRATSRVDHTFGSLERLFDTSRFADPEARQSLLKDAFTSERGLSGYAKAMHSDVEAMRNDRLAPLRKELKSILDNEVAVYLDKDKGILKEALDVTGPQGEEVSKEAAEVAHYDKKYKALAGSSGGLALAILLYSGGMLWPIAAFVGLLGIPAEKARKERADHIKKLIEEQEKFSKKLLLIADLVPLGAHLANLTGILDRLDGVLVEMASFWKDLDEKLTTIVKSTSIMSDGKRIGILDASDNQILGVFATAAEEWDEISEAADDFLRTSLVHSQNIDEVA